uniref:VOC family protein n=1 Tax=uncultured Sphingomonas sp. TaxID=158754 RepID=UPI0035C9CB8B
MPVLGIGGLFFRSSEPDALSGWYREHLGVGAEPGEWTWAAQGGPVVFAPFKADTDYFPADKRYMLNLRVSDLDGLLASLGAAGIDVITKDEWNDPSVGRFARIHDPEGNPVELWEPPAA